MTAAPRLVAPRTAPPRIVVLTGAGISAESGLGTFRDAGGLWAQYDLEEVATPEGYARNPDLALSFYNARRRAMIAAAPNPAHAALARLEAACPGALLIVTQNIDDLHERAGSSAVLHMHGALGEALCAECGHVWAWSGDMSRESVCPGCGRAGRVRPNVVWFGEMPHHMEAIAEALARAELFVSIGTSGTVYPAAGFVAEARALGLATLELNLEPSAGGALFDETRAGPASEIVPAWVAEILSAR